MVERPSDRQTKAQILEAYDELLAERKALATQVKQLQQQRQERPSAIAEGEPSKAQPQIPPRAMTSDKMTATIDVLAQLQLNIGGAISELSENLTAKATHLQQLQRSIREELEQLKALHQLEDIQPETLDTLIQTYKEQAEGFERERHDRQTALDQAFQTLQQTWAKEQEEHNRAIQERDEEYQKSQQREAQEYEYTLNLQRSLAQTEFEQHQQGLYRQLAEVKQEQEGLWAEREKEIAQQEERFATLEAQVAAFEAEKANAIQNAAKEGKEMASYQAKVAADLHAKEIEGGQRLFELQIQAREETIQNQTAQIQSLSKQLDVALKQVQDLALKAIEGSANIQSYQAFREIAMEQAKNQMRGK